MVCKIEDLIQMYSFAKTGGLTGGLLFDIRVSDAISQNKTSARKFMEQFSLWVVYKWRHGLGLGVSKIIQDCVRRYLRMIPYLKNIGMVRAVPKANQTMWTRERTRQMRCDFVKRNLDFFSISIKGVSSLWLSFCRDNITGFIPWKFRPGNTKINNLSLN